VTVEQELLARVTRRLADLGIPYMIAGSLASSFHGKPRTTHDADIVIDPAPEALDRLVAELSAAHLYVDLTVAREALRGRRQFNVIDAASAFKLDLIVRKDRPFSREEFARRQPAELAGIPVALATAEDTILSKLEWANKGGGSERQLADVAGIIVVKGPELDREYIERWASVLGVLDLWRRVSGREA
jgi:Mg-chelatase subunit ChlI